MTLVRILSARACEPSEHAVAVADLELDGAITIRGVRILDDGLHGGSTAVAPARPYGDGRPVLGWSDRVARAIVGEVRRTLENGGARAIAGPSEDPDFIRDFVFGPDARRIDGVPEAVIASPDLPEDAEDPEPPPPAGSAVVAIEQAIQQRPGAGHAELAEWLGLAESSVRRFAAELVAAGRVRPGTADGRRRVYYPAEPVEEASR